MKKNNLYVGVCAALLLASTLVVAEEYPAADFQPKVLFADEGANDTAVKNQPTPKAPAASAAKSTSVASSASAEPKTSSKASATVEATAAPKSEDSDSTMLIGLLALTAAGGFLFYKKQKCATSPKSASSANQYSISKDNSGLSGVARYIKSRELLSASGVERYLAKKEAATKATSSAGNGAVTGVEKYLKNKG